MARLSRFAGSPGGVGFGGKRPAHPTGHAAADSGGLAVTRPAGGARHCGAVRSGRAVVSMAARGSGTRRALLADSVTDSEGRAAQGFAARDIRSDMESG